MAPHCSLVHLLISTPEAPCGLYALLCLHRLPPALVTLAALHLEADQQLTTSGPLHLPFLPPGGLSPTSQPGWCPLVLEGPLFRKALLTPLSKAAPSPATHPSCFPLLNFFPEGLCLCHDYVSVVPAPMGLICPLPVAVSPALGVLSDISGGREWGPGMPKDPIFGWLCLGSAWLWAESLLPSADRCANFPSREALASGDEFLGSHGEIFLWNKEREILGHPCSCP